MNLTIDIILIVYFVFLVLIFTFIKKRLNFLTQKHFKNTKVDELLTINNKLIKIILTLLILMYLSGSYLILLFL